MTGDKSEISRGEELFQHISQGEKFKQIVRSIVADFLEDIDRLSYSPYNLLFDNQKRTEEFENRIDVILQNNALPLNKWWRRRLKTFILFKDKQDLLPPLYDFETPFVEISNHHVGRDGSYNDIRLYEGATQNDVKEFILKNWKYLKPSYREGTTQRIRKQSKTNIEINKRLLELSKQPKEILGLGSKEIAIARKAREEFDRPFSDDEVKARISRTKRKRR